MVGLVLPLTAGVALGIGAARLLRRRWRRPAGPTAVHMGHPLADRYPTLCQHCYSAIRPLRHPTRLTIGQVYIDPAGILHCPGVSTPHEPMRVLL